MNGYVNRASRLLVDHIIAPITGRLSTRSFWYLPAPPTVVNAESMRVYKSAQKSPRYFLDYRTRTTWPVTDRNGIVQLPYPAPIGIQYNPEAAFQTALGWHDRHLSTGDEEARTRFLSYADTFHRHQSTSGDFHYQFDYFEFKAPWSSALAQSRGASTMLRAFLLTGDDDYRRSALAAISQFDVPADQGGYCHELVPGLPFYEEYPKYGHFTFNGFLVALMGCYEIAHWLKDSAAASRWTRGCETLAQAGDLFFTPRWTLYDLDTRGGTRNPNSVFYHRMIIDYLTIIATLSGDRNIERLKLRAVGQDRLANRLYGTMFKMVRKINFR